MNRSITSAYDVLGRALFNQRDCWVSAIQPITRGSSVAAMRAVEFFMQGLEEHKEYSLDERDIWKLFTESMRMAEQISKGEIIQEGTDLYLIEQVPIQRIADQLGLEVKMYPGITNVSFSRKRKLTFEDIMIQEE